MIIIEDNITWEIYMENGEKIYGKSKSQDMFEHIYNYVINLSKSYKLSSWSYRPIFVK